MLFAREIVFLAFVGDNRTPKRGGQKGGKKFCRHLFFSFFAGFSV